MMRRRQPFSLLPLLLLLALAFLQVGQAVGHGQGIGKGHLRSRRAPENGTKTRTRDAKRQLLDLDLGLEPLLNDCAYGH